jgi:uncharacterized protein YjbJ (UPF0337 family)
MASGKSDELKGRVKEAAGAMTGDKKLKRQGKADQAVGKIKQKVEKVIDKVKDALRVSTESGTLQDSRSLPAAWERNTIRV